MLPRSTLRFDQYQGWHDVLKKGSRVPCTEWPTNFIAAGHTCRAHRLGRDSHVPPRRSRVVSSEDRICQPATAQPQRRAPSTVKYSSGESDRICQPPTAEPHRRTPSTVKYRPGESDWICQPPTAEPHRRAPGTVEYRSGESDRICPTPTAEPHRRARTTVK